MMISFVPQYQGAEVRCELIFLVDCSGSMMGDPINKAKDALKIFMQSLPEDCYFNIYCFGSTFESLSSKSVKYNEENLSKAKIYVENMAADLGGTEILEPLVHILPGYEIKGYTKQVFILTDGQVKARHDRNIKLINLKVPVIEYPFYNHVSGFKHDRCSKPHQECEEKEQGILTWDW